MSCYKGIQNLPIELDCGNTGKGGDLVVLSDEKVRPATEDELDKVLFKLGRHKIHYTHSTGVRSKDDTCDIMNNANFYIILYFSTELTNESSLVYTFMYDGVERCLRVGLDDEKVFEEFMSKCYRFA